MANENGIPEAKKNSIRAKMPDAIINTTSRFKNNYDSAIDCIAQFQKQRTAMLGDLTFFTELGMIVEIETKINSCSTALGLAEPYPIA